MDISTNEVTDILSNSAKSGGTITGDLNEYIPLVDRLLKNKFQLYNSSRQILTSDMQKEFALKPFQLFEDVNQNDKRFVLTSIRHNLLDESCTIELQEYDNTSEINLIDS